MEDQMLFNNNALKTVVRTWNKELKEYHTFSGNVIVSNAIGVSFTRRP